MRNLLMFMILLLSLGAVSCSSEKEEDMGQLAAIAAKGYYDELLQGKYEVFVDATYRRDSIPAVYRDQLIANAKMYIAQQNTEHQGIKEVSIANAQADTARRMAQVFLVLSYGDKTNEQIVVPMVERSGVWKMR